MNLRIMGTKEELENIKDNFKIENNSFINQISNLYKNKGDSKYYRLYIDINYFEYISYLNSLLPNNKSLKGE